MSFSLNISGHINNHEQNEEVDELVKAKGRELVAALADYDLSGLGATFSGPTGSANLVEAPAEDAAGG